MLVGQREKSRKYFDLSTFNYNLNDSNPCSSLGVMKFQKWELFSGSPGTKNVTLCTKRARIATIYSQPSGVFYHHTKVRDGQKMMKKYTRSYIDV